MTTLTERLASMGATNISDALNAGDDRRRKILLESLSQDLVEEFIGQPLQQQLAILLDAHRSALDLARTQARVAQEAKFRRQWSLLTGTEDLGQSNTGDLRQSPGTGHIDFSRLRRR